MKRNCKLLLATVDGIKLFPNPSFEAVPVCTGWLLASCIAIDLEYPLTCLLPPPLSSFQSLLFWPFITYSFSGCLSCSNFLKKSPQKIRRLRGLACKRCVLIFILTLVDTWIESFRLGIDSSQPLKAWTTVFCVSVILLSNLMAILFLFCDMWSFFFFLLCFFLLLLGFFKDSLCSEIWE